MTYGADAGIGVFISVEHFSGEGSASVISGGAASAAISNQHSEENGRRRF